MEQKNEHGCERCSYFIQHYTVIDMHFRPIHCGHCLKRRLSPKEQMSFPFSDGCELWVPKEIELEKRREYAERIILETHERLEHIAEILRER